MKKQLIICSPQLGLSPESNSGGEVYDREVINFLTQKEVKFFCLLPKNRKYIKKKNLKVEYAPITHMFPPCIFNFFVYQYLINLYQKQKFDILRVHSPYYTGLAAILFKKLHPETPIIASYLHLEEKNLFQSFIDKLLINHFDHIITISEFTKKEIMEKYKIAINKITTVYPGVDKKFRPQKKNKKLMSKFKLDNKKVLMFLGGLKIRKNPAFLLRLLMNIKDDKVILVFAGAGPFKDEIKRRAMELGLNNKIIFTGYVLEKQKVDFYNLADIILLPSLKEGLGMIAAEAQACGKPVIASKNSSLPEVIRDGQSGFLAKTNDIHDWLNKINLLLNNEKLRRRMGKFGEKFTRNKFSWKKNANQHLEVFKKILKEK